MCGIAGRIDRRGHDRRPSVERMTRALARRGPDAHAVEVLGDATLGHRRLSVIDLSAAAGQPMFDAERRHAIVFNGEIYNFMEVRAALAREGIAFRTRSDTEVVLEAWKKWGPDSLRRLTGMFALAIWDARDKRLFLARDRFGEKPLYYAPLPGGVAFASQLDALAEDRDVGRALDEEALGHFLAFGYTGGERAILGAVRKLPPATWASDGPEGFSGPHAYWSLLDHYGQAGAPRDLDAAAAGLAAHLDRAAAGQLIADVPVGAFLSGGIDSSAIVASLCRARPPETVETFSVGFDVAGFSETAHARLAARHLGTTHRDRVVASADGAARQWADAWDEPFADTSMVPTWMLARFARESVTVALSGDGGDELFGGYDTYVADGLRRNLAWLPAGALGAMGTLARAVLPARRGKVTWDFKLRRFLDFAARPEAIAHADWRRVLAPAEIAPLLRPAWRRVADVDVYVDTRRAAEDARDLHWLDRLGYVDIRTWMPDDILVKVDRATMAHGLEARAPFLDHRLAEFAAGLAPELKMAGLARKRVLKRSQRARLPAATLDRRKAGFNAPVADWIEGWSGALDAPRLAGEIFEPRAIESLVAAHRSGAADNGHKLFALANFALWRERFGV
ncbi:MAG: asparagine synthase (glutamine-hydrolyzing) [Tagaea sp.]|nr:asparagine synthase (glutamine-hydrolyzing) [Tagaea sp.]